MSNRLFIKVANDNGITVDDAKYVLEQSEKLMPILLRQYNTDYNMIFMKTREYQKILIDNCKKKNDK